MKIAAKRLFDLLIVLPALILFSPVMIIAAILVYLQLGHPVIFKQLRPGLYGRPFSIIKFTVHHFRCFILRLIVNFLTNLHFINSLHFHNLRLPIHPFTIDFLPMLKLRLHIHQSYRRRVFAITRIISIPLFVRFLKILGVNCHH